MVEMIAHWKASHIYVGRNIDFSYCIFFSCKVKESILRSSEFKEKPLSLKSRVLDFSSLVCYNVEILLLRIIHAKFNNI